MLKYISEVKNCITNMENVSKRIALLGYVLSVCSFFAGFAVYLWYAMRISDQTTGYYWFLEFCRLSGEVIAVSFVPVMLFELLLIGRGMKTEASR